VSASLSALMEGEGLVDAHEHVNWLLLTWDAACIGGRVNKYARFFLTDDSFLVTRGRRTERVFTDDKPLRGALDDHGLSVDYAFEQALNATRSKLAGNYSMVCRPMTVDCSDWDLKKTSGGENVWGAGHLVRELFNKTPTGIELLSHINATRYSALRTRLDPDWKTNFRDTTARSLWDGL
jgi:hypothetical protein